MGKLSERSIIDNVNCRAKIILNRIRCKLCYGLLDILNIYSSSSRFHSNKSFFQVDKKDHNLPMRSNTVFLLNDRDFNKNLSDIYRTSYNYLTNKQSKKCVIIDLKCNKCKMWYCFDTNLEILSSTRNSK